MRPACLVARPRSSSSSSPTSRRTPTSPSTTPRRFSAAPRRPRTRRVSRSPPPARSGGRREGRFRVPGRQRRIRSPRLGRRSFARPAAESCSGVVVPRTLRMLPSALRDGDRAPIDGKWIGSIAPRAPRALASSRYLRRPSRRRTLTRGRGRHDRRQRVERLPHVDYFAKRIHRDAASEPDHPCLSRSAQSASRSRPTTRRPRRHGARATVRREHARRRESLPGSHAR